MDILDYAETMTCEWCGTVYTQYDRQPYAGHYSMAIKNEDDNVCEPCMKADVTGVDL